ncbi:nucleotidyltransferase domain-containing protein [Natronoarchaeum rubrum]|uniref:nucleotidyltransferase domain-containing protein n=1 Tax=Natronoarchaeum rubrum TaxID=755311 RepID=UPI0035C00DDA
MRPTIRSSRYRRGSSESRSGRSLIASPTNYPASRDTRFGSVARGEADRASDIDVFVLVNDDNELVSARRTISDVKRDLKEQTFDRQRYEFEPFVESSAIFRRLGEGLRPSFAKGLTCTLQRHLTRRSATFRGVTE